MLVSPGTAQRHWLGAAFSFLHPFPLALAVRMVTGPSVTVSSFVANSVLGVLVVLPEIAVRGHDDEAGSAIAGERDLPATSVGTDGNRHRTGHLAWSTDLAELVEWQALRHQYAFIGFIVLGRREPFPQPFPGCWVSNSAIPAFKAVFHLTFVFHLAFGRKFN